MTKNKPFEFREFANARRFCLATRKMVIILGDHETFWVVTCADASRLMKAGYEAARF